MPTSIQQNTLTICEISYGAAQEAELHLANRPKSRHVLTGNEFDKYKDYIQKPIEDKNWCEWIEIRIPNPLLKVEKLCVFTKKVTKVFYVYETIWHRKATISDKNLKKIKGSHCLRPCWHKSYSISQKSLSLPFLARSCVG